MYSNEKRSCKACKTRCFILFMTQIYVACSSRCLPILFEASFSQGCLRQRDRGQRKFVGTKSILGNHQETTTTATPRKTSSENTFTFTHVVTISQLFDFIRIVQSRQGTLLLSCKENREINTGNSVLNARVLVKPKNMVLTRNYLVDDGTELFYRACCTCSKIVFKRSANQILNLWSFRFSYCHRCDKAPDKLLRLQPTVVEGNQSYTQEVWLRAILRKKRHFGGAVSVTLTLSGCNQL